MANKADARFDAVAILGEVRRTVRILDDRGLCLMDSCMLGWWWKNGEYSVAPSKGATYRSEHTEQCPWARIDAVLKGAWARRGKKQ